jgi:DNA-binding response OmpR family regulator
MQPIMRRVSIPVINSAPAAAPARGRRVLFVSADADLRAVVTRVLERENYRVRAVAHSGHALLLCRTAAYDVMVAELCGPDISGPMLAEQLRRHCPGMTALFLANPGTPEHVDSVVVRPFTRDDLVGAIEVALLGVAA